MGNQPRLNKDVLIVVPMGGAHIELDRAFLDIKATEGLRLYAKYWPGRVLCLYRAMPVSEMTYSRWYHKADLPFDLISLPTEAGSDAIARHAGDAAIILASLDNHRDLGLVDKAGSTPVVFVTEYPLRTELDILRMGNKSAFQKMKTAVWLIKTERFRRRELRRAAGCQANGSPAFNYRKALNPKTLLYFDTRLFSSDFIGSDAAAEKAAKLLARSPLRLVFSGRLESIKGADHLITVAEHLKRRAIIPFELHIFGDGSLKSSMEKAILAKGLRDHVFLRGSVDFSAQLVPFLKDGADLFLCCHLQDDPSCTYLETLGCGVPIVGYANRAFKGVLDLGPCGRAVKVGDAMALAEVIEQLDSDRQLLGDFTRGAAQVASTRLFESTFASRVDHLKSVAGLS